MFYHTDLLGNSGESPSKVALDMVGEFAVANCPSEELRQDISVQYFSEVQAGKREVGETLFFPGHTPEKSPLSTAEQWL